MMFDAYNIHAKYLDSLTISSLGKWNADWELQKFFDELASVACIGIGIDRISINVLNEESSFSTYKKLWSDHMACIDVIIKGYDPNFTTIIPKSHPSVENLILMSQMETM